MSAPRNETIHLALGEHERRQDGELEIHELTLWVPPELRWFRGHFPDNPVLPAVVQLQEVLRLTASIWPELIAPRRITNGKFRRPIHPADSLRLRLERAGEAGTVRFTYSRGSETCSSGVFEFVPPEGSRGE